MRREWQQRCLLILLVMNGRYVLLIVLCVHYLESSLKLWVGEVVWWHVVYLTHMHRRVPALLLHEVTSIRQDSCAKIDGFGGFQWELIILIEKMSADHFTRVSHISVCSAVNCVWFSSQRKQYWYKNDIQRLTLALDIGHLTDKICKCPIDVSYKRTNVLLICYKGGHCPIISSLNQDIVCVCVFEILVWLQSCVYGTWITLCIVFCHGTKFSS